MKNFNIFWTQQRSYQILDVETPVGSRGCIVRARGVFWTRNWKFLDSLTFCAKKFPDSRRTVFGTSHELTFFDRGFQAPSIQRVWKNFQKTSYFIFGTLGRRTPIPISKKNLPCLEEVFLEFSHRKFFEFLKLFIVFQRTTFGHSVIFCRNVYQKCMMRVQSKISRKTNWKFLIIFEISAESSRFLSGIISLGLSKIHFCIQNTVLMFWLEIFLWNWRCLGF